MSLWGEVWWQRDQVSPGRAEWPVMAVRGMQREAQELLSREGRSQMYNLLLLNLCGQDLDLVLFGKILGNLKVPFIIYTLCLCTVFLS